MKPEQFAYWLQGFVEVAGGPPTEAQWEVIKKHLDTVFKNVSSYGRTAAPDIRGGTMEIRGNTVKDAVQGNTEFLC